jgi:hypothetical protein
MSSNTKDISQYLHYYLGAECLWEHIEGNFGGTEIIDGHLVESHKATPNAIIKPLLYRIEDMSDQHKKELWELIFRRVFPKTGQIVWYPEKSLTADPRWVLMSGVERLGIEISGDVWADSDLHKWKFNPNQVAHYLLSKHYDLFGLIESGAALDRKTIQP